MNYDSRWRKWLIVVLGILLLVIMGITMGGRSNITYVEKVTGDVLTPVNKVFSSMGNFVSDRVMPILEVWNIKDENDALRAENETLKTELMEYTLDSKELAELRELNDSLNYVDRMRIDNYVSSSVIAKDTGNWYNMFLIDVGLSDGVTKNSTVMNGDGLIGLVYEAGDNWAKVISIIDNNSSIGFEMRRVDKDFDGLITGSVDSVIRGKLFDPQAEVVVGDKIMTSGVGLYPKGIIIGEIKEVIVDQNDLLTEVVVEPSVNFKRLNKVLVVPAKESTKVK